MAESTPTSSTSQRPVRALFGFGEYRSTSKGTLRLRLLWGRIFAVLAILFVLFWSVKTVGFYFFFKEYRDFPEVTLSQMVLFPINRNVVREQLGEYHLAKADELMKAGDFRGAFNMLRIGLRRAPGNIEARQTLARIYYSFRPDLAVQILEEGMPWGQYDSEYLSLYVGLLVQERQDDLLLELAKTYIEKPEIEDDARQQLAMAAAQANLGRGDFAAAMAWLEDTEAVSELARVTGLATIEWQAGLQEAAIQRLQTFVDNQPPGTVDPAHGLLMNYLIEVGRLDMATMEGIRRTINQPLSAGPRIDMVRLYDKLGRDSQVRRESDSLIRQFRDSERVLQSLSALASEIGDVDTARKLYEIALERSYNLSVFGLAFVKAHLTSEAYQTAVELTSELEKENPNWLERKAYLFNAQRAMAYFGIGNDELGQLYMDKSLQAEGGSGNDYLEIGATFSKLGFPAKAQQFYRHAIRLDPRNASAYIEAIEVDLELGDSYALADLLRHTLELRRQSYDVLEQALSELQSDRFIFTPNRESLIQRLEKVVDERRAFQQQRRSGSQG